MSATWKRVVEGILDVMMWKSGGFVDRELVG
jgi:hypothetical protein